MSRTYTASVNKPTAEELTLAATSYERYGLAALPKIADVTVVRARLRELYETLRHSVRRLTQEHTTELHKLGPGYRYGRLDPGLDEDGEIRRAFDEFGVSTWSREVAALCSPWLSHVTAYDVTYDRCFVLIYQEGDYIGPHGDQYEGHRINLQFPFNYETAGCMRVLEDGFLETKYDIEGAARVLGPRMWHEVPPLLRSSPSADPLRLVLSLRFPGVPTDPSRRYRGQVSQE
jgi:hypothetical protein